MSKFGSLTPSDKPYRVILKLDGKPIADKSKKLSYIDIYSEDSSVGRKFDKEWRDKCLAIAKDGGVQPTQLETNIAKCAALTAGWYLVDPDTEEPILDEDTKEPIPYTLDNANELYSLPLTTWIWIQPWAAANNHVNFIKRSAKSSTATQSGTSETVAS
jgi:hypothetical protein